MFQRQNSISDLFCRRFLFALVLSCHLGAKSLAAQEQSSERLITLKLTSPKTAVKAKEKLKTDKSKTSSNLAQMKQAEVQKNWAQCAEKASAAWTQESTLHGWIALGWLKCARRLGEDQGQWAALSKALQKTKPLDKYLLTGAWKNLLSQELIKSSLASIEVDLKANAKRAWQNVDQLFQMIDRLDRESRSRLNYLAGELAYQDRQFRAAQNYYSISLNEKESKLARERLNSLAMILNDKRGEIQPALSNEAFSEDEKKFEARLLASLQANDWSTFVDDGVTYLNRYPNGVRAKFVLEKLGDIEQTLWDSVARNGGSDKDIALRDRILSQVMKLEASRLLDWARLTHRRGDFPTCLKISEKALAENSLSVAGGTFYYLAGRCAHFLGDYKRAKKFFESMLELHGGSEDRLEVMLRLSLIHLRLGENASATAILERLLNQKGMERYELTARYWLIRSLQWAQSPRVESEIQRLVEKYPLTYYGIRLQSEKKNGLFEWPEEIKKTPDLRGEYFLTPSQKSAMDRVEKLVAAQWYSEAQAEISELPSPKDAPSKLLLAQRWADQLAFPQVIRLTNEAFDQDPSLRSMDFVSLSFPQMFTDVIEKESKAVGLHPNLIKSLIRQESAFGLRARSTSNALGLMQLIPPTALEVAQDLRMGKMELPEDAFEGRTNIRMGTSYLAKVIKLFGGSVPLGVAAYNAGPHRLNMFLKGRPETEGLKSNFSINPKDEIWFDELPWWETSLYVKSVLRNAILYQTLDHGRVSFGNVFWKDFVTTGTEVGSARLESDGLEHL